MKVGGQRHAPAALPPRKTRCPLYRSLGGAPEPVWTGKETLVPQPRFDPRTVMATELSQPTTPHHTEMKQLSLVQLYGTVTLRMFHSGKKARLTEEQSPIGMATNRLTSRTVGRRPLSRRGGSVEMCRPPTNHDPPLRGLLLLVGLVSLAPRFPTRFIRALRNIIYTLLD